MECYFSQLRCGILNPWLDPALRRKVLFLGGVPVDCSYEELYNFLRQFSEVLWLRIEVDSLTGVSKGFAYCILAESGYPKILAKTVYYLRGIPVGVQPWKDPASYLSHKFNEMERKVFIKRISPDLKETDLRVYFAKFGTIELCEIKKSHLDHSSRGIGFVLFSSTEEAEKCLVQRYHFVRGHKVECHKCKDRKKYSAPPEAEAPEQESCSLAGSGQGVSIQKKKPLRKPKHSIRAVPETDARTVSKQSITSHPLLQASELFEACGESPDSSFTAVDREGADESSPSQGVLISLKHLIDEC